MKPRGEIISAVGLPSDSDVDGAFWKAIRLPGIAVELHVNASWGLGWDHVSVSIAGSYERQPSWASMEAVRRAFFKPTETVVQIHAPVADYVSETGPHKGVLHLWRKQDAEHPLPHRALI